MNSPALSLFDPPQLDSDITLTEQISTMLVTKITQLGIRPGSRLPSVRALAQHLGVSRFTIVAVYNRLSDEGWIHPRQGAGYFVQARQSPPRDDGGMRLGSDAIEQTPSHRTLDVSWLLHGLLRDVSDPAIPGSAALLPAKWMDSELLASATRSVGRAPGHLILGYGHPRGYPPLRQTLASRLQALDIPANPDSNLLLTAGVTHAVDLVLRALTKPGDTVLVEDPAWFLVFGRLAAAGVQVLGVPRTPQGPDIDVLAQMAQAHRPKLFIVNSAVHNPTGYSLQASNAFQVLKLAQQHDFHIFEDDTYGDLHAGGAIRLAALDGLQRVLYANGFSKTLAAGLRCAFLAAAPGLINTLTDLKLLSGLTTPELNERVLQRAMSSGQFRRHLDRLRNRVDVARVETMKRLSDLDVSIHHDPAGGMFVWGDCHRDSDQLARSAAGEGMLLAPGSLFSPTQAPSSHIRFSVALAENPAAWRILEKLLG